LREGGTTIRKEPEEEKEENLKRRLRGEKTLQNSLPATLTRELQRGFDS